MFIFDRSFLFKDAHSTMNIEHTYLGKPQKSSYLIAVSLRGIGVKGRPLRKKKNLKRNTLSMFRRPLSSRGEGGGNALRNDH